MDGSSPTFYFGAVNCNICNRTVLEVLASEVVLLFYGLFPNNERLKP